MADGLAAPSTRGIEFRVAYDKEVIHRGESLVGTQTNHGLIWELDAPLPDQISCGEGNALYLSGECAHPHQPIMRLEVTLNERSYPLNTRSITAAKENSSTNQSLRSGFWGIIPIYKCGKAVTVRIGLKSTLRDRTVIVSEIGSITVSPQLPTVERESIPAPMVFAEGDLIAICMASYNPPLELFQRQIESIRSQTYQNWVCVISDDTSSPETLAEMRNIIAQDARFILSPSAKHLGFYHNFERSLMLAPREARYICLSDQDDYWSPDKLQILLSAIGPENNLVYSDARVVDKNGTVISNTFWTTRRNNYTNFGDLVICNTITGAASLFPRSLLEYLLPFPPRVGNLFHDHWIACIALALGNIRYVDRPLYDYVQHSSNLLGHREITSHSNVKNIYYLLHRITKSYAWEDAREIYFKEVVRLKLIALTISLRTEHLISSKKRKILRYIANLDTSLPALAWLTLRGLKDPSRINVT